MKTPHSMKGCLGDGIFFKDKPKQKGDFLPKKSRGECKPSYVLKVKKTGKGFESEFYPPFNSLQELENEAFKDGWTKLELKS